MSDLGKMALKPLTAPIHLGKSILSGDGDAAMKNVLSGGLIQSKKKKDQAPLVPGRTVVSST